MEQVVARGQARFVGVAGDLEACLAGTPKGLPYAVFQTALRPLAGDAELIGKRAGRPVAIIGHSVFGVEGAKDALLARLRGDPGGREALRAAGYEAHDLDAQDLEAAGGALLLDASLAANPTGL